VSISRQTVYRHSWNDPAFAERLRVCREHNPAPAVLGDWRVLAEQLERDHPERWALPAPWDATD
jgi:hypothetical protein